MRTFTEHFKQTKNGITKENYFVEPCTVLLLASHFEQYSTTVCIFHCSTTTSVTKQLITLHSAEICTLTDYNAIFFLSSLHCTTLYQTKRGSLKERASGHRYELLPNICQRCQAVECPGNPPFPFLTVQIKKNGSKT